MVPGGGVALIRSLDAIKKLKGDNEDQNHGILIAKRAMESPLREIVANAGEEPSVVLNKVARGQGQLRLQRARPARYGDMIEFGILDPTKVTRTALQNAASIAGLMITTEAMVAEAPKKDAAAGRWSVTTVVAAWAVWISELSTAARRIKLASFRATCRSLNSAEIKEAPQRCGASFSALCGSLLMRNNARTSMAAQLCRSQACRSVIEAVAKPNHWCHSCKHVLAFVRTQIALAPN